MLQAGFNMLTNKGGILAGGQFSPMGQVKTLSPFYDVGHQDWVEGKPSAYLPEDEKWRLVLHS